MENIIEDLESVIKSLRESQDELENIKKALEGKSLSRLDEGELIAYLDNLVENIFSMRRSLDYFTWAAQGPGNYKIEYTRHVYKIGRQTLDTDEKPVIKIEV